MSLARSQALTRSPIAGSSRQEGDISFCPDLPNGLFQKINLCDRSSPFVLLTSKYHRSRCCSYDVATLDDVSLHAYPQDVKGQVYLREESGGHACWTGVP